MAEQSTPQAQAVAKAYELVVAGHRIEGLTKQPQPDRNATSSEIIQPPVPPEQLAALSTVSGTRSSCIEAIARNTVGLGLSAIPRDENAEPDEDTVKRSADLLRVL